MKLTQVYRLVVVQEVDIEPVGLGNEPNEEAIEKAHDELESAVWLDISNIGEEIPYTVSDLHMESNWEDGKYDL